MEFNQAVILHILIVGTCNRCHVGIVLKLSLLFKVSGSRITMLELSQIWGPFRNFSTYQKHAALFQSLYAKPYFLDSKAVTSREFSFQTF